jgi:hypothetical protein
VIHSYFCLRADRKAYRLAGEVSKYFMTKEMKHRRVSPKQAISRDEAGRQNIGNNGKEP